MFHLYIGNTVVQIKHKYWKIIEIILFSIIFATAALFIYLHFYTIRHELLVFFKCLYALS